MVTTCCERSAEKAQRETWEYDIDVRHEERSSVVQKHEHDCSEDCYCYSDAESARVLRKTEHSQNTCSSPSFEELDLGFVQVASAFHTTKSTVTNPTDVKYEEQEENGWIYLTEIQFPVQRIPIEILHTELRRLTLRMREQKKKPIVKHEPRAASPCLSEYSSSSCTRSRSRSSVR